jgi:methylglutaconyl-CoA hydratase
MAGPALSVERRGRAAWVWLDRPETHNAFDAALIEQLDATFRELGRDEGVRCVVLAGRGRSFSAGADVEWMRGALELGHGGNVADARRLADMLNAIDSCPRPVVARVQGAALGGGCGLVACCDVALAAERAVFGFTETRLGLVPATIGPFAIAKIGVSQARALFLAGSRFDAQRALRIGLVHEVVPDEAALDQAVERVVGELCTAGPTAVAHAKRLLLRTAGHDPAARRDETAEAIAERRASEEGQEGLRAFLERRTPSWADG